MREIAGFFVFVVLLLLALFMVWFGLRSYGLSQPPSSYQTPLVRKLLAESATEPITYSDSNKKHALVQTEYKNQQWILEKDKTLSSEKQRLGEYDSLLLFFEGKSAKALPLLRELFKESELWKKTIFCSRFDGLLKDLRELEPEWTFCSGEIYMTRLLSFSSLGLESLLNITADVVFIHKQATTLSSGDIEPIIIEARRQNKMVIIGPVFNGDEPRQWTGEKPHAWMVQTRDQKVQ